jgi:hypothetical protein
MDSPAQLTRRDLFRTCGLAALLRTIGRPVRAGERLGWQAQPDSHDSSTRIYRADAQVVLLSVTLLRRSGVGAGRATWSENDRVRLLDFTGYSLPERAAGLNRFGFIRELSRKQVEAVESIYVGLMTASPEESATQARNALHKEMRDQLYTAIEGRVTPGEVETSTTDFTASAKLTVARHEELLGMARQALSEAPKKPPEFDPGTAPQRTFLQALADLLQDPARDRTRYVYNARLYGLWLRRSPDAKATAYFRGKHLIASDAAVVRAEGGLRRETGGKETNFQIWFEQTDRPIPLRIEYQAKPYLRLVFEVDESPEAVASAASVLRDNGTDEPPEDAAPDKFLPCGVRRDQRILPGSVPACE